MKLKIPRHYIKKSLDLIIKEDQFTINNEMDTEDYINKIALKKKAPSDVYLDIELKNILLDISLSASEDKIYLSKDDNLLFIFFFNKKLSFNENLQLFIRMIDLIKIIISYKSTNNRREYIYGLNEKYIVRIMDNASAFKNIYKSMYQKQSKYILENYKDIEDKIKEDNLSQESLSNTEEEE